MGLFGKGKTRIIAKFHRTDSVICSHSTEGTGTSYSHINMVFKFLFFFLASLSANINWQMLASIALKISFSQNTSNLISRKANCSLLSIIPPAGIVTKIDFL